MVDARSSQRLDGLDLARFIAFVGMVIVNFRIVMGASNNSGGLDLLVGALEGKAAATFIVLAGIGLGLAAIRSNRNQTVIIALNRAAFLLVIGLLNSLVFGADILHYYAFYFLFGAFCLPLSTRTLIGLGALVNLAFVGMILTLNYDSGWNWADYTYADFWTPNGFVRNLFFNGWHPIFPWMSFLLLGIMLSRLNLEQAGLQNRMISLGFAGYIGAELISTFLTSQLTNGNAELASLLGTGPIPPMPLYMLAGMSAAAVLIGVCLRLSDWLHRAGVLNIVTPAGRQTLTLYIAHILIGMGILEALGMLGGQSLPIAVLAALVFCVVATIYSYLWSKIFKRGPIEAAMRKISG